MRYRHSLPADYDMGRIRARIAARGRLWDDAPGLVFKAFVIEDRGQGAAANAYSSLYLWDDPAAAAAFFGGPGFEAVIETFGRPRTDLWLPFAVRFGGATQARSLAIAEEHLPPGTDIAALRRKEAEEGAALSVEAEVVAVVSGLDPTFWRLTRFVLRAEPPGPGTAEIGHLAAPGLSSRRAAGDLTPQGDVPCL